MATELKQGQTLPLSIEYLDGSGNVISPAPRADTAPAWANSNQSAGTLTASPDGMTASEAWVAAGSDTVRVQLSIGGTSFEATLDVTMLPAIAPSQVASIRIVPGTAFP